MLAEVRPRSFANRGSSLTEVLVAVALIAVGLTALAGVVLSVDTQRKQASLRYRVLARSQSLMEEIRSTDPGLIPKVYEGARYRLDGVAGAHSDGSVLRVAVESHEPMLLIITVTGRWFVNNAPSSLVSRTEILDAAG